MNVFKASLILGLSALVMLVVFPVSEGLLAWRTLAKYDDNGLHVVGEIPFYFFCYFFFLLAGTFLTIIPVLGLISFLLPFRKAFMGCGIFWIIILIPTTIYVCFGISLTSKGEFSYKDISISERNYFEEERGCCFYTDKENREDEDEDGETFTDYKVFANCFLINQTDPNVDLSNCEGSGDDMLCYASDVGISLDRNICKSGSFYIPYVSFVIVMLSYDIFIAIYALLHFTMFYLTKPRQNPNAYTSFVPEVMIN